MTEQGEVMSNREGTVTTRMGLDGGFGEVLMDWVGPTLPSDRMDKSSKWEGARM